MLTKILTNFKKINDYKYKKIIYSILSIIVITIIAICLVVKNLSYSLVQNNLSNYLGLKIELINPESYFNGKINFVSKAEYINIYDKQKSKKFISIKNPSFEIKPLSILFNKINIKNLDCDEIKISIKRDRQGKIDFLEELNKENLEKFKIEKYVLTRLYSKVNKLEFVFKDEFNLNNLVVLNLNNSNIEYSKKKKILKIKQQGTLELSSNDTKSLSNINVDIDTRFPLEEKNSKNNKFEINIDNFQLQVLKDLFKKYISNKIENLEGAAKLNITNNKGTNLLNIKAEINNTKLNLTDKKNINLFDKISLISKIKIIKDKLFIDELSVLSDELDIKLKGEISKIFTNNPNIDLKTDFKNTQINKLVYLLPDNLIYYRPKGIPTLKESNFFGTVDGSMNIKLMPIDISGNLKVTDIYIPNYPKPSVSNDVNLMFMKDKMRVYTKIYTPQNEYVIIDGISNLDDSLYGQYTVKSSKYVDLSFAKMYLVPIQQIIGFNIGPVPIMDISGTGNIDIKTKGTIFDAQIFGTFNAENASAKIEGLDAYLTKGICKLVFDNRTLIFKELKGKLGNADFKLEGEGNTKGDVDLNSYINNITTTELIKIFKNSALSEKYSFLTKDIAASSGLASIKVNLKGRIKDYENKEFLNELKPTGRIELINNKIILNNKLTVNKISGAINFGDIQDIKLNFYLNNSKIDFKLNSQTPLQKIASNNSLLVKSEVSSDKLNSFDLINTLLNSNILNKKEKEILSEINSIRFSTKFNVTSVGNIDLKNFDLSNLKNNGYIQGLNEKSNNIRFNSGQIKLSGNKLIFEKPEILISEGLVKFNGSITNYLSKRPQNNFYVSLKDINLENLNLILNKIKFRNSTLKNGLIIAKNNEIKFDSFNMVYQNMPVFVNAQIKNIFSKKTLIANFSTIMTEQTADNTINAFLVTPIKIKNEIPIKGSFNGQSDNYTMNIVTKIPKEADISFSGSNIGDVGYDRELSGTIDVNNDIVNVKNLKLIKFIKNQNKKTNALVLLKTEGRILQKNNELIFNNFKVETNNPTNVRILNSIFKKSLLKKGNFECNINLNGNSKLPKATGKLILSDLDIPLYDTVINNMKFNLSDKIIDGEILAKNKNSDIKINLKAQNKLILPVTVEKLDIESNNLNLKEILSSKNQSAKMSDLIPAKQETLNTQDLVIKNGIINAKEISYDKINGQNFKGNFSFDNNIFNLKSAKIDIAEGNLEAYGKYNAKTSKIDLDAKMNNCEANTLAGQFLNLNNQIFGKIKGSAKVSAKAIDTPDNIKDLKSEIDFSVENGKMPKLGSLEHLLRAGNLIKNGLFGLSLNNIIQVLTPYKTGEFEKISGNIQIKDAKIQNLEIYSKGKNLSLFLEGEYDILENFANIRIYGKLSQSISSALGKVGNASLSQFFNAITDIKSEKKRHDEQQLLKIPPIENEEQQPRYFKVKVLGDINKENNIKSFNWE